MSEEQRRHSGNTGRPGQRHGAPGGASRGRHTGRPAAGGRRDDSSGRDRRRPPSPTEQSHTNENRGEQAANRVREPVIPDGIDPKELGAEGLRQLAPLPRDLRERIASHLVAVGVLLDEDPQAALAHAQFARAKASRFGLVREALALVAYQLGDWQLALSEFRAARRISGGDAYLPPIVDCERALGRRDRAEALLADYLASVKQPDVRGELLLVAAGMKRDDGDLTTARRILEAPELHHPEPAGWVARLRYAYAELCHDLGETDAALHWFGQAAQADVDGETDATERLLELQGLSWDDTDATADRSALPGSPDASAAEGDDTTGAAT